MKYYVRSHFFMSKSSPFSSAIFLYFAWTNKGRSKLWIFYCPTPAWPAANITKTTRETCWILCFSRGQIEFWTEWPLSNNHISNSWKYPIDIIFIKIYLFTTTFRVQGTIRFQFEGVDKNVETQCCTLTAFASSSFNTFYSEANLALTKFSYLSTLLSLS